VTPTLRNQGIGSVLVKELINFCKTKPEVTKIVFTTANPESVKFYAKCGFTIYCRILFWSGTLEIV